ncbi:MAG TPA: response regulator [Anaerolineales bacterium]|nr:response regulator [Anaerolineales bacterium]
MTKAKKILIVDDEPLILRSMQKTLLRAGYQVVPASTCSLGLDSFKAGLDSDEPFDMALVDLNMPDFEGDEASGAGLELISRIQELQPGFPMIVLSAYDEVAKVKEAITRGARNYCVKGREQTLLDQIHTIFKEIE